MKKILIIGCGASGKSTLARKLGHMLQIPVIHLDMFFWRSGWEETESNEWRNIVSELCKKETWIMDGNFGESADLRYAAADTVIFLDRSPIVCLSRWFKRYLRFRRGGRPDMTEGCIEKFDLEYLKWIWKFTKKSRPQIFKRIEKFGTHAKFVRLTSEKDVKNFLLNISKS